jgi:WD40 repeat protein
METGENHLALTGHSDRVVYVAYSGQDDLLASGSWDKTVLWDVVTGQCQAQVQDLDGPIFGVAWNTTLDGEYLVTSGGDASVLKWEVTKEGGHCNVRLLWCATNGTLTMAGTSIQGVHGLSAINKELLRQRGVGEPKNLFRETGEKLVTITSVVSKLKESSAGTGTASFITDIPIEQPEQTRQTD